MTWLEPGHRVVAASGPRPRTTLTPTLVLRDGAPEFALGSPGGDQQDQWQLLALLRMIVGGYSPQQAIDAPDAAHHRAGRLVLAAHVDARRAPWSRTGSATRSSPGSSAAATPSPAPATGRSAGSPRSAATTTGQLWAAANPRGMQGTPRR